MSGFPHDPPLRPPGDQAPPDVEAALQVGVASGLIVAALIHFAVVDVHFQEWVATGLFFVVLGLVEVGLAAAVLARGRRRVYQAALVVTVGTLALWVESRTLGVPIGPEAWNPEAIGRPDLISTVAEVLTALLLAPLALPATKPAVRSWLARPLRGSTQLAVLAGLLVLAGWLATSGVRSARQEAQAVAAAERAAELNGRLVRSSTVDPTRSSDSVRDVHGH